MSDGSAEGKEEGDACDDLETEKDGLNPTYCDEAGTLTTACELGGSEQTWQCRSQWECMVELDGEGDPICRKADRKYVNKDFYKSPECSANDGFGNTNSPPYSGQYLGCDIIDDGDE